MTRLKAIEQAFSVVLQRHFLRPARNKKGLFESECLPEQMIAKYM